MIDAIWFQPPLAFARLGDPKKPLEAFYWGDDDELPTGTGRTTVLPAKTFVVDEAGSLRATFPKHIQFGSERGPKAVCPFFELHGRWKTPKGATREGLITQRVLGKANLKRADLIWQVRAANLKPYFMTQDNDTRIDAAVEIRGDDFGIKNLDGESPLSALQPLVPRGQHIPLGSVRLIRPTVGEPGYRLRFYPPRGEIYGPTNFATRDVGDEKYCLPATALILNPSSTWARWRPKAEDLRGLPGNQFAMDATGVSLGLVDDTSDAIISCRLNGTNLIAYARVVVTPPHYAPDRRHFISIADGLKDRVDRKEVHDPAYLSQDKHPNRLSVDRFGNISRHEISNLETARLEIDDLMERVFETMALSNLDAYNNRVQIRDNPSAALRSGKPYSTNEKVFNLAASAENPLPLVELGRQKHRRFSVLQILETHLRRNPGLFDRLVRLPLDENPFFDKRMPALIKGSVGEPVHLTRRQYDLLRAWLRQMLSAATDES